MKGSPPNRVRFLLVIGNCLSHHGERKIKSEKKIARKKSKRQNRDTEQQIFEGYI